MSRFDFTHPPFDSLTSAEQGTLEAAADIVFYGDEELIMGPGAPVDTLFVLSKGIVREMAGDEVIAVYHERDTFDARALVAGHTAHRFVVHEEALVYTLPRATLLALTEQNARFGAFFYASVSQKFGALAEQTGNRELQTLLTARVRDVGVKKPLFLDGEDSVLDAARLMKQHKAKSILVRHGRRVGIFTTSDFRDVIIDGMPTDSALGTLCRFDLICSDIDDYLFNALLTMTQKNIQRVVVTEAGIPMGVLEQVDLLSYFSNHSHLIAQRLEQADSLDELADIAAQITRLVEILAGHGVKAVQLGRLVQTLNARLFERSWRLLAPPELVANSCLLVMGSEGRGEQILKTDQDNALILRDGYQSPELERVCQAFSDALARFGYPPCPGRIMVCNADWRLSESAMRDRLYHWVYLPENDALLNLAIFVDAEAVAGDHALLERCHDYLGRLLRDDDSFYHRFARAIEQFDTPLGLFAQLLTQEKDGKAMLDLKKGGIFPIVHGARSLALEYGLKEGNTFDRLARLAESGRLDKELAGDVAESLSFLLNLRLSQGLATLAEGRPAGNLICPAQLSTMERDLLKEALGVVKRFKAMLRHHFKLGSF
ncbi:MAG: cyclic nucleotide-binding/CBS domain-containing protein [Pseudogulbenkiania sp.]|nr:cyclic nucleotide-binding/CBS domain-containing protein [Pseudogulbenkiania sp.]